MSNNALERTVGHRGRVVLATDCVLGGAEWAPCQAAQLNRWKALSMKMLARALILLPSMLLLGQCTVEFFAVDRCLDAGNVYDYIRGLCRSDVEHLPYMPYLERYWLWLVAAMVSIVSGITVFAAINRRKAP